MLHAAEVQKKKIEILTLYPRYDGMVKKPSHATVPLIIFQEVYSLSVDISFKDDVTISSLLDPKLSVSGCVHMCAD
jgi:hypothetical protein